MRPRVIPAEDDARTATEVGPRPASMRPRVIPAEDFPEILRDVAHNTRFNEAAGNPRGRRAQRKKRKREESKLQ